MDIVGQVFAAVERDADGTYWQMWADLGTRMEHLSSIPTLISASRTRTMCMLGVNVRGSECLRRPHTALRHRRYKRRSGRRHRHRPQGSTHRRSGSDPETARLAVTVGKVEFAAEETRVYVTVENGSGDEASFMVVAKAAGQHPVRARQLGQRLPRGPVGHLARHQHIQVIVFEAMDPSAPTKIYLEGRAGSYSLDFEPYVFTIPAE